MADLTRRILSIVLFLTLAWPLSAQVPEAGGEPGPAGKKLSVIVKPTPPFVMQKAGGVWAGISVDLWRKVAAEQGWEYEFRAVPDIPTLLDEIEAGKADVAVAATTMTAEREKRVDFSHGFFDAGLGIAVPGAKEAPIWTVMARVFSAQFLGVLLLLAALLFGVGALLWFLERRRNREQFGGETRQGLGNGFWWAAVTMTTVGYGDKAPVTLWGRMLALVWMFASIILISTFTAAIASSLTLSQLSTKVQGPGDLGHARVGVIEGTSAEDYCRDNNISPVRIADLNQALQRVEEGQLDALVYDAGIMQYEIRNSFAGRILVLPYRMQSSAYGFVVPEESPLKEPMGQSMLRILAQPEWRELVEGYLGRE